jgi:hypothetical protein
LTGRSPVTDDEAVKTVALEEIRSAKRLLRRGESILVVNEKRHPIGLLRPVGWPDENIPVPERRKGFLRRSAALRRQLQEKGVTERQIDRDIETLLKGRR